MPANDDDGVLRMPPTAGAIGDDGLRRGDRPAMTASPEAAGAACPRLDALPSRELGGRLRVAEATTRKSRRLGLARLDELPPELALYFRRCRQIHTVTMRFPLDLIWLDKRGNVVRVDRDVPPWRLKTCLRARSVVEAGAGTADAFIAAGVGAVVA